MSILDDAPYMMLIVRRDAKMSAGKISVQCAHAAVECALACKKSSPRLFERWRNQGAKKICVFAEDLKELMGLHDEANHAHLTTHVVKDAGKTELAPGTVTVLGIGPATYQTMTRITSHLPLV